MFEPLRVVTIEKNKRTHQGCLALFPASGPPVGEVGSVNVRRPNPKAVAYAKLFAAAPDLLEALKEVPAWFEEWNIEMGAAEETLLQRVNAAIAKVEAA